MLNRQVQIGTDIATLKKAFATYAKSKMFRASNKYADFEAERVAMISMRSCISAIAKRINPNIGRISRQDILMDEMRHHCWRASSTKNGEIVQYDKVLAGNAKSREVLGK